MKSLVETTAAERESWAALESTPDEDGLQRLVSDAARAAEFEGVMVEVLGLLLNDGRPNPTGQRCSRCGASSTESNLVWLTYQGEADWNWGCEDYMACARRAKKETP